MENKNFVITEENANQYVNEIGAWIKDAVKKAKANGVVLGMSSGLPYVSYYKEGNKIFENKNVSISRLSYGIPMGAEIDYLDVLTLDKALDDRKKIS